MILAVDIFLFLCGIGLIICIVGVAYYVCQLIKYETDKRQKIGFILVFSFLYFPAVMLLILHIFHQIFIL